MKPFSDLNALLQNGYSFEYNLAEDGTQTGAISIHEIGDLVLTSGNLLTWDLFMIPDSRYFLTKTVKPGRYPVALSVATFNSTETPRIACAIIRLTDHPTMRWEVAAINDPDPEAVEEGHGYGVDSGTGSFMDLDAANVLSELVGKESPNRREFFAVQDEFQDYCDKVIAEMDQHSFGGRSTRWARMAVDGTEANVIAFSSGWGDGGYASFWGYDASDNLTCLVTDFALFSEG